MQKLLQKYVVISFLILGAVLFLSSGEVGTADAATFHAPIVIDDETDLNTTAMAEGWPGTGSISDPYIISDYDIIGTEAGRCIYIGNTTSYVTIRDCILHDAVWMDEYYAAGAGVHLYNTENVLVENNSCYNNVMGAYLRTACENNVLNENNCSDNDQAGICLYYMCNYNTLSNNICNDNVDRGIMLLSSSNNNVLSNNTCFSNSDSGIYIYGSDNNIISNNTCDENTYCGISLTEANLNTITNNSCNDNIGNDGAIDLYVSSNNTVAFNTCNDNTIGIRLYYSSRYNTIEWNTCDSNYRGIYVYSPSTTNVCDHNTIANNTCTFNENYGLDMLTSSNNSVLNNDLGSNPYGLYLASSSYNLIEDNDCDGSTYGIYISLSHHNVLRRNTCNGLSYGTWLSSSNYNLLSDITCQGAYQCGIRLSDSNNNAVLNSTCGNSSNGWGIALMGTSHNNTVFNNTCNDNNYGIYLVNPKDNTVSNNTCNSNTDRGIFIEGGSDNVLRNNTCTGNNNGIYSMPSSSNDISDNVCSGNANYGVYLFSSTGCWIGNNTCDDCQTGIYVQGCDNITVFNNTCEGGTNGIYLYQSPDCRVMNCTCSGSTDGITLNTSPRGEVSNNTCVGYGSHNIYLTSSEGCQVIDNTCSYGGQGIYSLSSPDCVFLRNDCNNNTSNGIFANGANSLLSGNSLNNNTAGIYLHSSDDSIITENICDDGANGIYVYASSRTTVSWNHVRGNAYYGIYLEQWGDASLHNNTCTDNGRFDIYLTEIYNAAISNNTCIGTARSGIYLEASPGIVISNNTCSVQEYGIYLGASSNSNQILDNNCSGNGISGIYLGGSGQTIVTGNNCTGNGQSGIAIEHISNQNTISNNICNENGDSGISLLNSDLNDINNNTCIDNALNGIRLEGSGRNTISNNICHSSSGTGIYVYFECHQNTITDNDCSGSYLIGIRMYDTTYLNTVSDNDCSGSFIGIRIDPYCHNNTISDNDCTGCLEAGIVLNGSCVNNTISNNDCSLSQNHGIHLYHTSYNILSNNICNGSVSSSGIFVEGDSHDNRMTNNTCSGNHRAGIYLYDAPWSNIIENNTCDSEQQGVYLDYFTNNNTVSNNSCSGNTYAGIYLYMAVDSIVSENNCSGNQRGIYIYGASRNYISDNTCENNVGSGIEMYSATNNTLSSNLCRDNVEGINLRGSSDDNTIEGNTCDLNSVGIFLMEADRSHVSSNVCTNDSTVCITLESSSWCVITYNICSGELSDASITMSNSANNTISNNTLSGSRYGIYLISCSYNTISDNDCSDYSENGVHLESSSYNLIANNHCDLDVHGVHLMNSGNNTVTGNALSGNDVGVYLSGSTGNIIANNTCTSNSYGVFLISSSDNNDISGNLLTSNGRAICMDSSDSNSISDNNCSDGSYGIQMMSSDQNHLWNNLCADNSINGIHMGQSNDNVIFNNTLVNNDYGLRLYSTCIGNLIYGNALMFNNGTSYTYDPSLFQAYDDGSNDWNYSGSGNHWSDWLTPDDDMDGIVDVPYIIQGGSSKDHFPLANSTLNITSPVTNTYTNGTTAEISGRATGALITTITWYNAANGASGDCYGTNDWNGTVTLIAGSNVITVTITDELGGSSNDTVTIICDLTAPSLTIISPGDNTYDTDGNVTVEWNATDASGIDHYAYSADGTTWTDTSDTNHTFVLSDGFQVLRVRAYDIAGNVNETSITVIVDTTEPTLQMVFPTEGYVNNTGSIHAFWDAVDATSGLAYCSVSTNGTTWTMLAVNDHTFLLADGAHTLYIRAYDAAGNYNETTVNVTVDTIGPALVILSPSNNTYNITGSVTVTWNGSDDGTGIDHYEVSSDGTTWTEVGGTDHSFSLADGVRVLRVRAYDGAGNMNETSVTVIVDTVAPSLSIAFPAASSIVGSGIVNVTWTSSDATSGTDRYEVSTNGIDWTVVNVNYHVLTLADGSHTVHVLAYDEAGNSIERNVTFTVDTTAPALNIVTPADGSYNNTGSVTVEWSASDASGIDHYAYSTDGTTWTNTSMTDHAFVLADGSWTVHVRAYDGAGNINESSVTFIVDTTDPELEIMSPANGSYNNTGTVTLAWEASDATAGISKVEVSSNGTSWTDVTGNDSHAFALADGEWTLYVRVTDYAGNVNGTNVSVVVDTVAPTAQTSPVGNDVPLNATIIIVFSEQMSGTPTITLDGASGTIVATGGITFEMTPSALEHDRTYTVNVTGADLAGNTVSLSWTFNTTKTGSIEGALTDADGNVLANVTVTLSGGAVDVTDAYGRFSFTGLTTGNYTLTIALEGYGSITRNVSVVAGQTITLDDLEMTSTAEDEDGGSDSTTFMIAAVILVIAVVGAVLFYVLRRGKAK